MGAKERPAPQSLGVVIAAAGTSQRMQGVDKAFYELEGVPVLARAIACFCALDFVREVVVVCRRGDMSRVWDMQRDFPLGKVSKIVAGGQTRQESVFAGVRALDPDCALIAIHDGARPFVRAQVVEDCTVAALAFGAAAAAVPVKDTIKRANADGVIIETPARESLFVAQTPQIFERALYLAAMENACARGVAYTDDCQLIEALRHPVYLCAGDYLNFKITTPEDLILAQALAAGDILEYRGVLHEDWTRL